MTNGIRESPWLDQMATREESSHEDGRSDGQLSNGACAIEELGNVTLVTHLSPAPICHTFPLFAFVTSHAPFVRRPSCAFVRSHVCHTCHTCPCFPTLVTRECFFVCIRHTLIPCLPHLSHLPHVSLHLSHANASSLRWAPRALHARRARRRRLLRHRMPAMYLGRLLPTAGSFAAKSGKGATERTHGGPSISHPSCFESEPRRPVYNPFSLLGPASCRHKSHALTFLSHLHSPPPRTHTHIFFTF